MGRALEIPSAIERLFQEGDRAHRRNLRIVHLLREFGLEATDIIIPDLFSRRENGMLPFDSYANGFPLHLLISLMTDFAQSRHELEFARMLTWEQVLCHVNRAPRWHLLSALKRVGTSESIVLLRELKGEINKIPYAPYYQIYQPDIDNEQVGETIAVCEKRVFLQSA